MQVDTVGQKVISTLTDVLWYLDPHQEKFRSRGITMPEMFAEFSGFYDWRHQKKKAPLVTAQELKEKLDRMVDLVMISWIQNSRFSELKAECVKLIEGMKKYLEFLEQQQSRTKMQHESTTPIRSLSDAWHLSTIEAVKSGPVDEKYKILQEKVDQLGYYEMLPLQDLEPSDRYDRRSWLSSLALTSPVALYQYDQGNYLGNLNFIWKLPAYELRSELQTISVLEEVRKQIPIYSTRNMRKTFMERYHRKLSIKPAVLRDVYRYLTGDEAAPEYESEKIVDDHFIEWLMNSDEPDLMYDLRRNNGMLAVKEYEPFWEELQKFLDEKSVVHERRANQTTYMPIAISVEDLRNQVMSRLPSGCPAPSNSWIRMNFWPRNPYSAAAKYHTGKFQVKYAVQQRLLRSQHMDASYCAHLFSYVKEMAIQWKEQCTMICIDDKAVIPIGEPGTPISTGVRTHNRSLVQHGETLVALDHDFHKFGMVPSVLFKVDIPSHHRDSFHRGEVHVTVKDKVFQPSSAMRHCTEIVGILREICSNDDVALTTPILIIYSDGGPDHRTTFWSVQLSYIIIFIALDLDMLIAARTAPMQSYCNPAERTMATLNLALQNVALCRAEMSQETESRVKNLSTMNAIRKAVARRPELQTDLEASTQHAIKQVEERFARLKACGEPVQVHKPRTKEELDLMFNTIKLLDHDQQGLTEERLSSRKKADETSSADFIRRHCRERQYMYQIKKCTDAECAYCTLCPPRVDNLEGLHWVPDPTLDPEDKEKYRSFSESYGCETDDSSRPSAATKPLPPTQADKNHKSLFVAGKVRGFLLCRECGKRRVYYSNKKLDKLQVLAVERVQEELVYTCGCPLFRTGPYKDTVVVKEALSCQSPMETTYYSGVTTLMDPVCCFCGDLEISEGDIVKQLQCEFGIVRPICNTCLDAGKRPQVRNALKVKKNKK